MDIVGKNINNRYRIIGKIVDSKFSTVWEAKDIYSNVKVLINLIKKDESIRIEDVLRFRNEVAEVSSLSVSGIEKIFDIGECEDYYYVTREFIRGKSLKEMIYEEQNSILMRQ